VVIAPADAISPGPRASEHTYQQQEPQGQMPDEIWFTLATSSEEELVMKFGSR